MGPNTLLTNILGQVYNSNEGPHRRKGFKLFLHTKNTDFVIKGFMGVGGAFDYRWCC